MRKFNQLLMYRASIKPDIILKFESLDSTQNTFVVPKGYGYMDIFLVNGGNAGSDGTGGTLSNDPGNLGEGGKSIILENVSISEGDAFMVDIGAGGASNGALGGLTQLRQGGDVIYSPEVQDENFQASAAGYDGKIAPSWVNIFEGNYNLYGAGGGSGKGLNPNAGGNTGGGRAGYSSSVATAGSFYGAGGGAGYGKNTSYTYHYGAAGYQGVAFIRLKVSYTERPVLANGIYIGYDDNSVSAYNELVSGKTPKGVVIKTDDICILLNPSESTATEWSTNTSTLIDGVTTTTDIDIAKQDFAGKANTDAVIASGLAGSAFTYVRRLGRQWYLPACGEMAIILANKDTINIALSLIGGTRIEKSLYWSSTQYSASDAYYHVLSNGHIINEKKGNLQYVSVASRAVCAFELL